MATNRLRIRNQLLSLRDRMAITDETDQFRGSAGF